MATLNRTVRLLPSARPCLLQHPLRATFSTSQSRRAISTPSPETSKRTAIVTGSSRGIGKAIALRLARDGYDVCINDIPANSSGCDAVAEEVERLGRRACVALADISKFDEVEGMIQTSVKKLGELNTMIANAGIAQVKPLLELTEEDFERMFRINVFGCQNTYKAAAKQLIAQGNCKPDNPGPSATRVDCCTDRTISNVVNRQTYWRSFYSSFQTLPIALPLFRIQMGGAGSHTGLCHGDGRAQHHR